MTSPLAPRRIDIATSLTVDYTKELVAGRDTPYQIDLSDGPVTLFGNFLLVNLILWRPLLLRGLPVEQRHLVNNVTVTKKEIKRVNGAIYRDVIARVGLYHDDATQILFDLLATINALYTLTATALGAHHRSISAFELADTILQPEVQKAIALDLRQAMNVGIQAVEAQIEKVHKQTMAVLGRADIQSNILYPYVHLDILSSSQLPQVVSSGGTRTDVNDMMINLPIRSPYNAGMANICELALDSMAAKKSAMYNASGMPESQYSNRKMQLMASSVQHLYPGDCGSTVLIPFEITEQNYKYVIGKYVINPTDGACTEITWENTRSFINQIVHWRSVFGCRHTDGICHMCGGRLTDYMPHGVNPGIAATIDLMGPTAQLILSNKHVSRTSSVNYVLPVPLRRAMHVRRNEIYLDPHMDFRNVMVGIPFECMTRIGDLRHIDEAGGAFNDQYFSGVHSLMLAQFGPDDILTPEVPMADRSRTVPYFSADFLMYMKNNPELVEVGEMIWIKLTGFDRSKPIMRCVIRNDSMLEFTNRVKTLFTQKIVQYTSIPHALRDFANDVYKKVDPNIMHLEVIMRACLITSPIDYSIPEITDPNKVTFGPLQKVIQRRSLGAMLAFERFNTIITDPSTFTISREVGAFDAYVGFDDRAVMGPPQ